MPTANKKKSFDEFIQSSELPVLVDFWAPWCGPCKMMEPVIKDVAKKMKGKIKVIKVNSDEKPHIAQKYQVRGIPTFILFKNGSPVWRTSGAMQGNVLVNQIESNL